MAAMLGVSRAHSNTPRSAGTKRGNMKTPKLRGMKSMSGSGVIKKAAPSNKA